MMGRRAQKILNLWVAYFMPLIMMALVGYGTWVFAVLVCVKYIMIERKENGVAIALLTLYLLFFSLLALAYFRTVLTVNLNPGYIKKGKQSGDTFEKHQRDRDPRDSDAELEDAEIGYGGGQIRAGTAGAAREGEDQDARPITMARIPTETSMTGVPANGSPVQNESATRPEPESTGNTPAPTSTTLMYPRVARPALNKSKSTHRKGMSTFDIEGLRKFLNKDVFVCQLDGLPRWCVKCCCWKPDRSHHCSEVDRCVWKMDHFCPWVGGVVAETSYRYFYQVVFWGLFYCLHNLIALAVYINKKAKSGEGLDSTWIAAEVLFGVFGFFCAGMVFSTTQFIFRNQSTIDAINADGKTYTLAIRDPSNPSPPDPSIPRQPGDSRVWLPPADVAQDEPRICFVVVQTLPGENPWLLESHMDNIREALGWSVFSWFLPWGIPKPGTTGGEKGFYNWNQSLVSRLKKEAGIYVVAEKTPPMSRHQ